MGLRDFVSERLQRLNGGSAGEVAPTASPAGVQPTFRVRVLTRALEIPPELQLLTFLILVCVGFAFVAPNFATSGNLDNLGQQASVLVVVAIAQMLVIVVGGLDLSVGAQVSLLGLVAISASNEFGMAVGLAVTVIAGCLIGLVNGSIISYLRVSPVIATLGTWQVMLGISLWWTQGISFRSSDPNYTVIGQDKVLFLAIPTAIALLVIAVSWVVLNRMRIGRYIYAIGGNPEAARLSGIDVPRYGTLTYVLCSLFVAIGAITLSSRTGSADALQGDSYLTESIAAAFIGGAAWSGGVGTVMGATLGALLLVVLQNGFNLVGIPTDLRIVITGALIVLAVIAYGFRRNFARRHTSDVDEALPES